MLRIEHHDKMDRVMLFLHWTHSAVKAASTAFIESVLDHPIKTIILHNIKDEELPNKSSVRFIARPKRQLISAGRMQWISLPWIV